MKRENRILLIVFVLTALAGCGLHFLYQWSPNLLFAVLSPVRESVWEHLKLVYWPMLAALLLYTRRQKEQRAGWYLGLLTVGALLLIYGWVYNIRMVGANLAVDIAAYVVILALGFAVALWIPVTKRWRSPLLMLTGVLAVLVVVFTFTRRIRCSSPTWSWPTPCIRCPAECGRHPVRPGRESRKRISRPGRFSSQLVH